MEPLTWDIILKIAGLVVIIFLALIASSGIRHIKIDHFGSDNDSKRKVLMKLIANLYIFLSLCLILITGIFKMFNEQVILLLFVSGLAGLGVKLIIDLKD